MPPRRAFEPYLTLLICAVLGGTIGAIASFSGSDNIITIAAEAFGPSLIDQHEHRARRLVGVLIILASLATAAGGLLHYYLVARTTG